jgi:heme exporter protein A
MPSPAEPPATWQRVEVQSVSCAFGRVYALHRVTTTFEAGTLVALLGPNGAGKSTLLSVLSTLLNPDRGEVLFDGVPLAEVRRQQRAKIGYVSHDALLYPDLTGYENLWFFGRLYGLPRFKDKAVALLERVGLSEAAAAKQVRTYSRGMRQRLSIARALLQDPCLLLLDEPFTGIDRDGCGLVESLLAQEKAAGRIVLMSTHRLDMSAPLIDEVRMLESGRLRVSRALTAGESLLDAYKTP